MVENYDIFTYILGKRFIIYNNKNYPPKQK